MSPFRSLHREFALLSCVLAVSVGSVAQAVEPASNAGATQVSTSDASADWGLSELARQLINHNPQLLSARQAARAGRLGVTPAGAPDNPTLTLTQDPLRNTPLSWSTSQGAGWTVAQNIYWPGKKSLTSAVVAAQASAGEAQVEGLQSQLLGQLRSTWLAWQASQAQLQLTRTQLARLEQIKDITKLRYAQNAAAFADYINAQVTQEQIRTTLLTTQLQADTQLSLLSSLVGHTSAAPLPVRTEDLQGAQEVPAVTAFREAALQRNPQVKTSAALVQAAQRAVELAELGRRPDFNLAVTGHAANPPWGLTNTPTYGVAVGMTFPLWYSQKEKWLLEQAQVQLASASDALESQQQQVVLAVNTAWLQWSQNLAQLQLVESSVLSQARMAYRLALSNYSLGQMSYVEVLNAFNTERSVELLAIQARANALAARVALDTAVGETALSTNP